MHDRDGQLHLGDIPLSIDTSAMSDLAAIRDDMRRAEVGVPGPHPRRGSSPSRRRLTIGLLAQT